MESVPKMVARNRGNATFAELVEATSRRALAAAVNAGGSMFFPAMTVIAGPPWLMTASFRT
jgi:hypothetical protein